MQHQGFIMHTVCNIVHSSSSFSLNNCNENNVLFWLLFQENKSYGSKKPFAFILWCTKKSSRAHLWSSDISLMNYLTSLLTTWSFTQLTGISLWTTWNLCDLPDMSLNLMASLWISWHLVKYLTFPRITCYLFQDVTHCTSGLSDTSLNYITSL